MKIEKLLGKFGMKGITYGPRTGGKALLSLDEQLAVVGISWKESPVGFHILFVECLSDRDSARELYQLTWLEAAKAMQKWRGVYPPKAIEALCLTAMAEATQQLGQLCPECNGAGRVTNKHRVTRKCPCCKEGRIEWTTETRFALFCQKLPITYSRFKRYSTVLEKLVEWLVGQRTAAVLALQGRVEREEAEVLEVA
ncbi:hypothetical protein [Photobacterium alginatilyticum]|uniref:Antitermination protein n=1 Tax=Photobacterium alginatilyticum TaxID=1775171 RepID=A0ABW9YMC9_9GAMM|nr:hypothetical protein [Photobacterium alginatilyticum]NBI54671.1 hypothetical protein [Photobacterium alginatilyticum]